VQAALDDTPAAFRSLRTAVALDGFTPALFALGRLFYDPNRSASATGTPLPIEFIPRAPSTPAPPAGTAPPAGVTPPAPAGPTPDAPATPAPTPTPTPTPPARPRPTPPSGGGGGGSFELDG